MLSMLRQQQLIGGGCFRSVSWEIIKACKRSMVIFWVVFWFFYNSVLFLLCWTLSYFILNNGIQTTTIDEQIFGCCGRCQSSNKLNKYGLKIPTIPDSATKYVHICAYAMPHIRKTTRTSYLQLEEYVLCTHSKELAYGILEADTCRNNKIKQTWNPRRPKELTSTASWNYHILL